jgi:uncharacterized protein with von Willebrand factor type A (vWA) domain
VTAVDRETPEIPVPQGRLPENIAYFARTLRGAGMRVGPAAVVEAVRAVEAAGIGGREDFYWTLHCIFVKRREDHPVFDEAFRLFWRPRDLVEKMIQMFSPVARPDRPAEEKRAAQARVAQSMFQGRSRKDEPARPEVEIDARLTASDREVLRRKDFAQMSAAEIAQARKAIDAFSIHQEEMTLRRFEPSLRGRSVDPRRTLASSLRSGGDLILPKFRRHREVLPPVVILADISGSMSQYSRVFLHFAHALMEKRGRVHAFLFGTRLTNVTRQLRRRDPDEALDMASGAVEDWSGGTRIGPALHEFNRLWSRRVLGQGAIVLLFTDGLEREGEDILGFETDRLRRSCRRLVWLNPLLRFEGFEARARGVRAMLPHVDEFRACHSLDSLSDLCDALGAGRGGKSAKNTDPRQWLAAAA